jgi:predicted negative regulator of RcsB-dependent stress response
MPRTIKKKISKKNSDTETNVQEKLEDIRKSFQKRQKTIAVYGLIGLSAVIVIGGIALYRYNANVKAQQLEYEGVKVYSNLYRKTPAPGKEKARNALVFFTQAYEKKKSPGLLLYIADAHSDLGQFDEALKALDTFTKKYSRQQTMLPLAYQKMADVQLRKGNREEALKALGKIASLPGDLLKDVVLAQTARLLEQEGKKTEAIAKYRELTEKYPASPYAEEAKAKITEKKES